jgi:hypothetical protein
VVWRSEVASPRDTPEFAEGPDEAIRAAHLSVSPQLGAAIEAVLAAEDAAHSNAKRRGAFVAVGNDTATNDPTAQLLGETYNFFVTRAHLDRATSLGPVAEDSLRKHFERFETIVSARIGSFFAVGDELSDILDAANARNPSAPNETDPTLDEQ